MDERVGKWTDIKFTDKYLLITLRRNHRAGLLAGIISSAILITVSAFSEMPLPGFYVFAILIVLMTWRSSQIHLKTQKEFPIVIFKNPDLENLGATAIPLDRIRNFEVKENTSRDPVEDPGLVQIWLVLNDGDQFLIHQGYLAARAKVLDVAKQLESWLRARHDLDFSDIHD